MKNQTIKGNYTLLEISRWNDDGDSEIRVPALQRGLVWKASQMELLWDSILRGFPVGAFVVAKFAESGQEALQLLDGQQRMNAIKLGFKTWAENNTKNPILWFDLNSGERKGSTRKYWVKTTTPAHPWGYANNDDCSKLTYEKRRDACAEFNVLDKFHPKVTEAWPVEASLPIPLSVLVRAMLPVCEDSTPKDPKEFLNLVKEEMGQATLSNELKNNAFACLEKKAEWLFQTFKHLPDYKVATVDLPKEDFLLKADGSESQVSEVECLFERMNRQGTQVSPSDLTYSVIKAYFPEIKSENESVAKKVMSADRLVMLGMRLALTEKDKFQPTLSLSKVRTLAQEKGDGREKIVSFFKGELKGIVDKVQGKIRYSTSTEDAEDRRLPPVLVSSIIYRSPEVYLLLMWLIRQDAKLKNVDYLRLATLLHWYTVKSKYKKRICDEILRNWQQNASLVAIKRGLQVALQKGWLVFLHPPKTLKREVAWDFSKDWSWEGAWNRKTPYYWEWIEKTRRNKELILYAQRHYLAETFKKYDPANVIVFGEDNRPWDMDHIIPHSWLKGTQGVRRGPWLGLCEKWRDCIGNLAAIPLEINRSKSNSDEWSEYADVKNREGLVFKEHLPHLDVPNPKITKRGVRDDKEMAVLFANLTKARTIKIYETWFDELGLEGLLDFKSDLAPTLQDRKELFLKIKEHLGEDACCYFIHEGREFQVKYDDDIYFCKDWVSVGVEVSKECMVCLSSNASKFELGIRKVPSMERVDKKYKSSVMKDLEAEELGYIYQNSGWWYVVKSTDVAPDAENVAEELKRIVKKLKENVGEEFVDEATGR